MSTLSCPFEGCTYTSNNKANVRTHFTAKHPLLEVPESLKPRRSRTVDERKLQYECDKCHQRFAQAVTLAKHTQLHLIKDALPQHSADVDVDMGVTAELVAQIASAVVLPEPPEEDLTAAEAPADTGRIRCYYKDCRECFATQTAAYKHGEQMHKYVLFCAHCFASSHCIDNVTQIQS